MPSATLYGRLPRGFRRSPRAAAVAAAITAFAGIAAGTAPGRQPTQAAPGAPGSPPAIIGDRAVTWSELTPLLVEAAGGAVLEEVVLDRAIAAELERQRLKVRDEDIARERALLVESVATAAQAGPDEVEDLVARVRRQRGLGEARFNALLRRNAGLRRLVAGEVVITPEDVRQAYEIRHGERRRVRLIVTATDRKAAEALARVRPGPGREPEPFGEVAAELSVDPSALRGGVVEPISPLDPTYPAAVRQAIAGLAVGQVSDPIAIENGFVIARLEEVLPPTGRTYDEVAADIEAEIRLVRERVLMDRLAARLLAASPVIVMDRSLDWSWQTRREAAPR